MYSGKLLAQYRENNVKIFNSKRNHYTVLCDRFECMFSYKITINKMWINIKIRLLIFFCPIPATAQRYDHSHSRWRRDGGIVSALDSGSSGPGSSPGGSTELCSCLLIVPLSTQVYKWYRRIYYWGQPRDGQASHPGGSRNTPNRFLRPDGPLGSNTDLTSLQDLLKIFTEVAKCASVR